MSFFKNNKTNTNATVNENATTEENTNKGGGLLTTLAVAGGTILGITAAVVGGRKVYKHFHEDGEIINSDDDSKETENSAPVEDFREVDTEETVNNETVEAEEAKADVTVDETTTEAEEAKVEEPKKSCWDAFKDPKEAAPAKTEEFKAEDTKKPEPVEDEKSNTEEPENPAPVEDEKSKTEETKETETMQLEKLIGKAVSAVPYDKPETVDLAYYVRCMGGYLHKIDMEDAGHTGRFVIAEQCIAMTNLVISAIIHMASGNINDLEDYHGVYGDIKRLTKEFKASKIMKFTQKPELCEEKFNETLDMVEKNLTLTKQILALKEAKPAASKTSTGETKTVDKVEGETKTSAKVSKETKSAENCFDAFKKDHKESNKVEGENQTSAKKVAGETKTVTKSGKKQTKTKASRTVDVSAADPVDAINKFAESTCEELVKSSLKSLASLNRILDVNDQKPCEWLNEVSKYVDSNIECLLKTNHKTEAYKLMKVASRDIESAIYDIEDYMLAVISGASTIEELDDAKESVVALTNSVEMNHIKIHPAALGSINNVKTSLHNMYDQLKSAGETKTAEPVVDEKQAATKESPSETQIGNSTVISDDGETVTLKASVSEESVQNVKDVIDIVSKIPNREDPEKNDMAYFIRVIGGRIHKITEPEATFVAYDEASNSNKFMDACVEICNMTEEGICNLANSDNDPVSSMAWINKCTDELVASGIIDNTYDPRKYKAAILKARKAATDKLSKRITPEIAKEHGLSVNEKSSDETQADDKSSGETQTEETLTYTMSEKIQEAVQQSDETAATVAPEPDSQAPMSPEASSLALKLQEVGSLMRSEKWSEAAEFYKTQLTPYLADDSLSKELRNEIMGIKTKATNMLMSQKQLEAKQKAASAKASKKASKKRRRH